MITTHHIREFPVAGADIHLYCGRESSFKPREGLVNAKLGNPYPMSPIIDRTESILMYEAFLLQYGGTNENTGQRKRIARITELDREGKHIALYCFCKPDDCHTDIIRREALRGLV